jgi:carboxylesterase
VFPASASQLDKESTVWPKAQIIAKGHSPFIIGHGKSACLLVHGIAASPAQMRALAEFLAESGFTVRGMLLPGHGTHPSDLEGIVWQDWYEAVHGEYCELKRNHEEVHLIGFSIGAAVAAHYGAHNPVDRLVLLSIPLCPLNGRYPTNLMLNIYGTFFKYVRGKPEVVITPDGKPFCFVYGWVPTAILRTMTELIRIIKHRLDRIQAPTLIIQSENDNVSGSKSGPLMYRGIGSPRKRLIMLRKSGHNVIMDGEQQHVFRQIDNFLSEPAKTS